MIYRVEQAGEKLFDEIAPLLFLHYKEIAHFKDIPLNPDFERYLKLQETGHLRVFTARDEKTNELLGYAIFIVSPNMHYKDSLQAVQDVLYIRPDHRGRGARFITLCDRRLKEEGVQAVYQHVKAVHNFGPMLERLGYECVDHIYAKRLDAPQTLKPLEVSRGAL